MEPALNYFLTGSSIESRFLVDAIANSESPSRIKVHDDARKLSHFIYPVKFYSPFSANYPGFNYLAGLSDEILSAVANRRAIIVFDTSNEGDRFKSQYFTKLHARLHALQLPASQFIYLTQNELFGRDYLAWAQRSGQQPIATECYHYFLRELANYVTARMIPSGEYRRRKSRLLAWIETRGPDRPKHYLSLNYTPRPHRVATMLFLLSRNLTGQGLISFPGLANRKYSTVGRIESLLIKEPFADVERLAGHLPDLLEQSPFLLDVKPFGEPTPVIDVGDYNCYETSCFSFVTESGAKGAGMKRFTEKPFKAVLGLHPFIVLGLPGTLQQLHAYGFKTFHRLVDERYDTLADDRERVATVLELLSELCRYSVPEINKLSASLLPEMLHNYDRFGGPLQDFFRETIERQLLARLHERLHRVAPV